MTTIYENNEALAKFLAERINGGSWEDPQYYTEEQRELWRGHAIKIRDQVLDLKDTGEGLY